MFFIHLWIFCWRIQYSTFLWMMKVDSKKVEYGQLHFFRIRRTGRVDVYWHSFWTLEVLEVEWSNLSSSFFFPRKRPRYPLNGRLNGSQFRYGRFWRGGNHLTGIWNPNLQSVASSYIGYVMAASMIMEEEVCWDCLCYDINIMNLEQLSHIYTFVAQLLIPKPENLPRSSSKNTV